MIDPSDIDIRFLRVRDAAGDVIGRVEGLVLDPRDSQITFLEVASGTFFGHGKSRVLFPVGLIASIENDEVRLSATNTAPNASPIYRPAIIDDYRV
ncbi:hypothetical protein AX769_21190 (plasmid) [Frondihabitans sp. PAMC 28766]|nr:hypothetical protein AX769_21190 [Frondihabitans sp. PAMC 28766]